MTKKKDPQLEHRRDILKLVESLDLDKYPTGIIQTRIFYGAEEDLKPESEVDIIILTNTKAGATSES